MEHKIQVPAHHHGDLPECQHHSQGPARQAGPTVGPVCRTGPFVGGREHHQGDFAERRPNSQGPARQAGPTAQRRGVTLILMLCIMIIVAVVAAGVVATMMADRQLLNRETAKAQAEWMAAAGLERGAARLIAAGDYRGETWPIEAAKMDGKTGGSVVIRVEPQAGNAGSYVVSVESQAGKVGQQHARAARRITVNRNAFVSNSGEKP